MPASAPIDHLPCLVARTLAPTLLALALSACGTGSPPVDAGRTTPVAGAATGDSGAVEAPAPTGSPLGESGDETTEGDTDAGAVGSVVAGPVGCDAPSAEMQARALELINAARAEARVCGDRGPFAATSALGWDSRLEAAARTHSTDMAATGNFSHTGTDGSSVEERIERAGYEWGEYAENIAAGQTSLESAVASWLESPGHCRNLMAPGVSDVAVACVANEDARFRHYWTNVLARPFERRNRP